MNGFNGIKEIIFAVLKGMVFFAIGVLIFSAVFNFFTVNESYIPIVRCGLLFLSSFLTGIWSSKKQTSKGYLRGLISGLIFAALLLIFSLVTNGGSHIMKAAVTYLIVIIMSVLGGIIGINVNN